MFPPPDATIPMQFRAELPARIEFVSLIVPPDRWTPLAEFVSVLLTTVAVPAPTATDSDVFPVIVLLMMVVVPKFKIPPPPYPPKLVLPLMVLFCTVTVP